MRGAQGLRRHEALREQAAVQRRGRQDVAQQGAGVPQPHALGDALATLHRLAMYG